MTAQNRANVRAEDRMPKAINDDGRSSSLAKRPGVKTRSVPAGTMVFSEGDPASEAFIVISGMVEISIRKKGKKVVLARLCEGQMFGEMGIISNDRRSASAFCLADCELMVVDSATIEEKIRNADPYLRFLVRSLIDMVREASQRL